MFEFENLPIKQTRVNNSGQCISTKSCCAWIQIFHNTFTTRHQNTLTQRFLESLFITPAQYRQIHVKANMTRQYFGENTREEYYMKSSAAVLRWNWDLSSLGIEESASLPSENSTLPRWRIAATTLNIASCMECQRYSKKGYIFRMN